MTEYGHVKISRKAYATDPYWTQPREFSKWEAWEWMIQAAAWKPYAKVTKRAGVLKIERGETPPLAERFLADHWGWGSKNRARRFLDELQQLGRIRTGQRTADGTTYHLVNYARYQSTQTDDGPRDGPLTDQTRTSDGPHADQNRSRESSKAEKRERDTRAGRARPLPAEWSPNEQHKALADERGVHVEEEAAKMRDWAASKGESRKDWDATFRNWLRNADPPRRNGNGHHASTPAIDMTEEQIRAWSQPR